MRTSRIFLGFFNAPILCLLWQTKQAVISAPLSAPEVVTGVYGGSVSVSCQYDQKFREYTKYWCKGPMYEFCKILVKTPNSRSNTRSFIVDDKEAGVFTVTMTSLNQSDEGMYWCVIARRGKNNYAGVQLQLSEAAVMTTTATTPPTTHEENSWWTTLRWLLFILMLSCVVATQIITWRIKTTRRAQPHQQLENPNSNIYE